MSSSLIKSLPGYSILREAYNKFGRIGCSDEHWIRVIMNRETARIIKELPVNKLKALELSGDRWAVTGFASYQSLFYPDYDICGAPLAEKYDLIIAEQVFEHLLWPYRAGRNVYEMLNRDGYFLITTPFLIRIHNHPVDCSRWTETGIKHFLAECGFNLNRIKTGSWGNRSCLKANLSEWKPYRAWLHSIDNEPDYPLVVWAIAQK